MKEIFLFSFFVFSGHHFRHSQVVQHSLQVFEYLRNTVVFKIQATPEFKVTGIIDAVHGLITGNFRGKQDL
jgi:hypothetical protein